MYLCKFMLRTNSVIQSTTHRGEEFHCLITRIFQWEEGGTINHGTEENSHGTGNVLSSAAWLYSLQA